MGENRYKEVLEFNKHQSSILTAPLFTHLFTYKNYEYWFSGVIFMGVFHPLNRRIGMYKKHVSHFFIDYNISQGKQNR